MISSIPYNTLYGGYADTSGTAIPNFRGKNKASQTRAWLARQEWQDYLTRFAPREKELIQRTSREGAIEELNTRLGSINLDTQRGFKANKGTTDRLSQRYGVTASGADIAARDQVSGVQESLSNVDAINKTRDHIANRNVNVIGGGGGTSRQLINGGGQ